MKSDAEFDLIVYGASGYTGRPFRVVSSVARWRVILDEAVTRVACRFVRAEPRRTAAEFVEGLLSGAERAVAGAGPTCGSCSQILAIRCTRCLSSAGSPTAPRHRGAARAG